MKNKTILLLFLVLCFASCEKEELPPISSLDGTTIEAVLHQDDDGYSDKNPSKTVNERRPEKILFSKPPQAACTLRNDKFSGNYELSYVGDATGGFGIPFEEGTVLIEPVFGFSTMRSFNQIYLPDFGGFFVPDLIFNFDCDQIVLQDFESGLSCAGGQITIVQGEPSSFDFSDDSEIILNIIDYQTDGNCGVSPQPKTIKLTKE